MDMVFDAWGSVFDAQCVYESKRDWCNGLWMNFNAKTSNTHAEQKSMDLKVQAILAYFCSLC